MIALIKLIGGTPWMLAAVLIAASGTFGFYKGWMIEHDAKIAAVSANDALWRQAIDTANAQAEADTNALVRRALEAAAAVQPVPADRSGVERLCGKDPDCRDRRVGEK